MLIAYNGITLGKIFYKAVLSSHTTLLNYDSTFTDFAAGIKTGI
jgi:hypothetical protein